MSEYRIYVLSSPVRIDGSAPSVICDSDAHAVQQAAAQLVRDGHLAEVWEGARLVRRLGPVCAA